MKRLEHERLQAKRLKNDNEDLQYEFERDRQGYLNTIRFQENQSLLYRTILDKMSALLPRNCNYANIDQIIEQARYDDEKNRYSLPDAYTEDVQFPQLNNAGVSTNGNGRMTQNAFHSSPRGIPTVMDHNNDLRSSMTWSDDQFSSDPSSNVSNDDLERRYGRQSDMARSPLLPTRSKRQEQLLNETAHFKSSPVRTLKVPPITDDSINRRLNPFETPSRITRKYGFSSNNP
jgi:hypothetical protein